VVGAGMAAATEWVNALAAGAAVVSVRRREPLRRPLNVPRALFSRPGSPLNKALGLGLQGPVADEDLHRIESFYASRSAPTQIELCPLVYGDVPARLCARAPSTLSVSARRPGI